MIHLVLAFLFHPVLHHPRGLSGLTHVSTFLHIPALRPPSWGPCGSVPVDVCRGFKGP